MYNSTQESENRKRLEQLRREAMERVRRDMPHDIERAIRDVARKSNDRYILFPFGHYLEDLLYSDFLEVAKNARDILEEKNFVVILVGDCTWKIYW